MERRTMERRTTQRRTIRMVLEASPHPLAPHEILEADDLRHGTRLLLSQL